MFLFNPTTGELKQSHRISKDWLEVSAEQYSELQKCNIQGRLELLPDLDVHDLNATGKVRASSGDKYAEMDEDGLKANGGVKGKNAAGEITITIDGPTGNVDTVGKITAASAKFVTKPEVPDAKGQPSITASMNDVAEAAKGGIQHLTSPEGTLSINDADKSNATLDVKAATVIQRGAVKPNAGLTVLPDGTLNIKMATDVLIGGVIVKGGGTGIDILPDGTIYLDGAISPFLYMGTWSAKTNIPAISDKTGKPDSFYLCLEDGEQDLGSGKIAFAIGDWALCEEDEGKPGTQHYVNVPMSKAMVVSASQVKAGTLGNGVAMDTDQQIKTSANVIASILQATSASISGKVTANTIEVADSITAKNITITGKMTFTKG